MTQNISRLLMQTCTVCFVSGTQFRKSSLNNRSMSLKAIILHSIIGYHFTTFSFHMHVSTQYETAYEVFDWLTEWEKLS